MKVNRLSGYILDSSAVLAVILEEKGAEFIKDILDRSFMSTVNFSEVLTKLLKLGVPVDEAKKEILQTVNRIIPFNIDIATLAGKMIMQTERFGLSLGDRACIATGEIMAYDIITADKIWGKLKLSVKIKVIR